MDEREQIDAEINRALAGIDKLINPAKSVEIEKSEIEMEELVDLVQDIDVKRVGVEERVNFAAQIEEIESKVTDDVIDHTELDEADIKLDPRMPKEGRERFLRAR